MPHLRSRSAIGPFVALIAAAVGIACTSVRPVGPGDVLRAHEGLLVLHVRTERSLRSISISGRVVPLEVRRPGTHLSLIAVSAGRHRWSGLGLPVNRSDFSEPETVQVWFRDVRDLRFTIEPGSINYAGMLEVYDHDWYVSMRSVDRTALAIEALRSRFAAEIAQYPITYSGSARHVFLERYRAAQSSRGAANESARGTPR